MTVLNIFNKNYCKNNVRDSCGIIITQCTKHDISKLINVQFTLTSNQPVKP